MMDASSTIEVDYATYAFHSTDLAHEHIFAVFPIDQPLLPIVALPAASVGTEALPMHSILLEIKATIYTRSISAPKVISISRLTPAKRSFYHHS